MNASDQANQHFQEYLDRPPNASNLANQHLQELLDRTRMAPMEPEPFVKADPYGSHYQAHEDNFQPQRIQQVVQGGAGMRPAFELTLGRDEESNIVWRVSDYLSVITDGTNGNSFDLSDTGIAWAEDAIKFNTPTVIEETQWIVLEAKVDPLDDEFSPLRVSEWTLAAVPEEDAVEVSIREEVPISQVKVRLLIGKVTIEDGEGEASQAVLLPAFLTHGFTNGLPTMVIDTPRLPPDIL